MKNETKITTISNDYMEELLTEKQASKFLGLSHRTLQGLRFKGGGAKFIKLSSKIVRYRRKDLINWIEAHQQSNTSAA